MNPKDLMRQVQLLLVDWLKLIPAEVVHGHCDADLLPIGFHGNADDRTKLHHAGLYVLAHVNNSHTKCLIFLDKKLMDDSQLGSSLSQAIKANPNLRVFISGDRDARHGTVIHALDVVRSAGIDKVAFEVSTDQKADKP